MGGQHGERRDGVAQLGRGRWGWWSAGRRGDACGSEEANAGPDFRPAQQKEADVEHRHTWRDSVVSLGPDAGSRVGMACECGLVTTAPMRADKAKTWRAALIAQNPRTEAQAA